MRVTQIPSVSTNRFMLAPEDLYLEIDNNLKIMINI